MAAVISTFERNIKLQTNPTSEIMLTAYLSYCTALYVDISERTNYKNEDERDVFSQRCLSIKNCGL
jgi:hypothetical protein